MIALLAHELAHYEFHLTNSSVHSMAEEAGCDILATHALAKSGYDPILLSEALQINHTHWPNPAPNLVKQYNHDRTHPDTAHRIRIMSDVILVLREKLYIGKSFSTSKTKFSAEMQSMLGALKPKLSIIGEHLDAIGYNQMYLPEKMEALNELIKTISPHFDIEDNRYFDEISMLINDTNIYNSHGLRGQASFVEILEYALLEYPYPMHDPSSEAKKRLRRIAGELVPAQEVWNASSISAAANKTREAYLDLIDYILRQSTCNIDMRKELLHALSLHAGHTQYILPGRLQEVYELLSQLLEVGVTDDDIIALSAKINSEFIHHYPSLSNLQPFASATLICSHDQLIDSQTPRTKGRYIKIIPSWMKTKRLVDQLFINNQTQAAYDIIDAFALMGISLGTSRSDIPPFFQCNYRIECKLPNGRLIQKTFPVSHLQEQEVLHVVFERRNLTNPFALDPLPANATKEELLTFFEKNSPFLFTNWNGRWLTRQLKKQNPLIVAEACMEFFLSIGSNAIETTVESTLQKCPPIELDAQTGHNALLYFLLEHAAFAAKTYNNPSLSNQIAYGILVLWDRMVYANKGKSHITVPNIIYNTVINYLTSYAPHTPFKNNTDHTVSNIMALIKQHEQHPYANRITPKLQSMALNVLCLNQQESINQGRIDLDGSILQFVVVVAHFLGIKGNNSPQGTLLEKFVWLAQKKFLRLETDTSIHDGVIPREHPLPWETVVQQFMQLNMLGNASVNHERIILEFLRSTKGDQASALFNAIFPPKSRKSYFSPAEKIWLLLLLNGEKVQNYITSDLLAHGAASHQKLLPFDIMKQSKTFQNIVLHLFQRAFLNGLKFKENTRDADLLPDQREKLMSDIVVLAEIMQPAAFIALMQQVGEKMEFQKEVCDLIWKLIEDKSYDLLLRTKEQHYKVENFIHMTISDRENAKQLIDFLTTPIEEYSGNRHFLFLSIEPRIYHRHFWSLPDPARILLIEQLMFPWSENDALCIDPTDDFDFRPADLNFLFLMKDETFGIFDKAFPKDMPSQDRVFFWHALNSYLDVVKDRDYSRMFLCGMLASMNPYEENLVGGQKMVALFKNMGIAGIKFLQALGSLPQLPESIHKAVKYFKTETTALPIWERRRQIEELMGDAVQQFPVLGKQLGAGASGTTIEAVQIIGDKAEQVALTYFPTHIRDEANLHFSRLTETIEDMLKSPHVIESYKILLQTIAPMVQHAQQMVESEINMDTAHQQIWLAESLTGNKARITSKLLDGNKLRISLTVAPYLSHSEQHRYKTTRIAPGRHFIDIADAMDWTSMHRSALAEAIIIYQLAMMFGHDGRFDYDLHGGNMKIDRGTKGRITVHLFDKGGLLTEHPQDAWRQEIGRLLASAVLKHLPQEWLEKTTELKTVQGVIRHMLRNPFRNSKPLPTEEINFLDLIQDFIRTLSEQQQKEPEKYLYMMSIIRGLLALGDYVQTIMLDGFALGEQKQQNTENRLLAIIGFLLDKNYIAPAFVKGMRPGIADHFAKQGVTRIAIDGAVNALIDTLKQKGKHLNADVKLPRSGVVIPEREEQASPSSQTMPPLHTRHQQHPIPRADNTPTDSPSSNLMYKQSIAPSPNKENLSPGSHP